MFRITYIMLMNIMFFSISIQAQEVLQEFSFSKSLTGENTRFDMAVNHFTGDVVIVWERLQYDQDNNYLVDGIYYAFAKRKPNGKYRIIGPKYLYKSGQFELYPGRMVNENYQFPDVEFDPDNNRFLVVISSSNLNISKSRIINSKGKLSGPAKWIWPDDQNTPTNWQDMTEAVIGYIPESNGQFRIFFRHDNTYAHGSSARAGIFTGILNSQGQLINSSLVGPVFEHLVGEQTSSGGIKTIAHGIGAIYYLNESEMFIAYSKPVWNDSPRGYTFISSAAHLDSNGIVIKARELGEENSSSAGNITPLSQNLYLFTFQGDWNKEACQGNNQLNSILNSKLKQKGATRQVIPDQISSSAWTVKLGQDVSSYQIFKPSDEEAFYGRILSQRGKYGEMVKLINTESNYGFIKADALPGSNDIFVAWMKSDDSKALAENEIRGFFLKVKG